MSHLISHVAVLGLMAAVVYGSGWAFEKRLSPARRAGSDLTLTTRWILGLAWWTVGLFVLATVGALSGVGLAVWTAITGISAWASTSRTTIRRPASPLTGGPPTGCRSRTQVIGIVLGLGLAALPLLLIALGPTRSWDAEVYHLSIPKLYVENGGFRNVDMSVYSHWPLGTELVFAAALILQDFITAKLVHFGFGLLILMTLFESSNRLTRGRWIAASTAALLFLANDVVLFEMRSAYVDLAFTFYTLAAFLLLCRAADSESRPDSARFLGLAGLAAALLASTKITGIVTAGLLAVIFLPRLIRDSGLYGLRMGFRPLLLRYALPATAGLLPWSVKSAVLTGNPFYPMFWSTFGGPDWSPSLARSFAAWQQGIGMGREPIDYLLLLPRLILFGDHGYDTFDGKIGGYWILILPLVLVGCRRLWTLRETVTSRVDTSRANTSRALGVAALLFVFWALSSQQMRFLIPALALVCWAAGSLVDQLPRKVRWLAPILSAMLLFRATDYPRLVQTSLRYVQIFASGSFDPSLAEPAVTKAVHQLPAEAKILLLQTNHRFAISREVLADSFFEASQIVDWLEDCRSTQEIADRLRARGVTHVLLSLGPPRVSYPDLLFQTLQNPAHAQPIYRDERFLLFELRD